MRSTRAGIGGGRDTQLPENPDVRAQRRCHTLRVPMRVLIVDDHPPFRVLAGELLSAAGFDVVGEAGDGRTAVASTCDLRPDVVLLDIQLPDIDGFEVLRLLRLQGVAPAVVLTSSRDASDYGDALATSAAAGFIPKADLSGQALCELLDCA